MTGFGDARCQDERLAVAVEVRTVNNRYLKIVTKCSDMYAALEGDIEKVVREKIGRGTVNVSIRVNRLAGDEDFLLNQTALKAYWSQLRAATKECPGAMPGDLGLLLSLPGIVSDERRSTDIAADWTIIRNMLVQALDKLQTFRVEEGRSMERDLLANALIIATRLDEVVLLAPQVVTEYRAKMLDRVRQLLKDSDVNVTETDLIREVSIFSEKADINEEITRLKCHLEQFQVFLKEKESTGRKLEFLTQEMFREVNTIGSKANNVPIAHAVVDMKAAVEKIREVLQNVE